MEAQSDALPLVMTVEEAARFLRIGRSAAYEAVRTGLIPSVRVGRLYRIPRDSLLAWLQENAASAGTQAADDVGIGEIGEKWRRYYGR